MSKQFVASVIVLAVVLVVVAFKINELDRRVEQIEFWKAQQMQEQQDS